MRLISYNVNGLRAALSKGWLQWLQTSSPDILCLQETKALPDQLPITLFNDLGYHTYWHSAHKKGYSGVAIFCKKKPDEVLYGCKRPLYDAEGRFLCIRTEGLNVVSLYLPSGTSGEQRQAFKMQCLHEFETYIQKLMTPQYPNLVLGGDFNICHRAIDIHDPIGNKRSSGFLPEEREWMSQILNKHQLTDSFRHLNPHPHHYSWWSFRQQARARNLGWRIDYWLISNPLQKRLQKALILKEVPFSDHCPILLQLKH